jgi:hypothetical protein
MAAVYKSLNKGSGNATSRDADAEKPRNRQRVLMLSSRGVTMRYAPNPRMLRGNRLSKY